MNDSRPRNNQGQFAPDEQGGMDPNTTSAAYNPQIIEARKASLAEKLRRAIGVRRGVEESVPLIDSNVVNERIRGTGGAVLFNHGGHGEHGGVKEFSILNKISNLTGMAQIKAGRDSLELAKINRGLRDAYRADAVKQNKFPYGNSDLQYKIESGMRGRAIERGTYAKYDVRRARKLINEGVRRRNISIGVGAGVVGAGAGAGYLATREKDLSAKLRLRELADISIGTAKKVLREIRAGNPGLRIFRPESSPMMAQYISPHTSKKMIKAAREQLVDFQPHGRDFKLAPNSMIVPRDVARRDPDLKEHVEDMKKMVLSSIPKKLVPIQQAAYKKAESLNSPVGMALHEAGHATMPESVSKNISKLQQAAARNGGISMTDPYFKTGIDEEYRANREVLNKIKQHGTPQEADSWRKRSQDQIKIGYRAPVFNAAMMQEASPEELEKAMAGLTPLSLKRRVLQKYPHIRKQQLSAKLRLRELARQAAYDPYAVQAQPAEPGQVGRDFRNAALGIAALGAGGGVAYAGFRGAQAAKSAQTLTDDALKTSGEARKAARTARVAAARFNRAGKVLKTQLTTFPTFKKVASKIFEEELKNLKELAARSVELNSITYAEALKKS